jgi:hypothetical protein
VAGEEQSQQYVGSLQGKSHRQHDPHSDGLLAPSGGFEPPLFDRFHSGEVEILVASRALNKDLLDPACVADMNFQQCCPLKALSPRRFWIAGFDLIPAERTGNPTIASQPCAWWQTGDARSATHPGPPGAQSGTARAAASTTGSSPRHDSYISPVKELAGASFTTFHRLRRRSVRRSLYWWSQDIATNGSLGSRRQWHG